MAGAAPPKRCAVAAIDLLKSRRLRRGRKPTCHYRILAKNQTGPATNAALVGRSIRLISQKAARDGGAAPAGAGEKTNANRTSDGEKTRPLQCPGANLPLISIHLLRNYWH